MTLSIYGYVRWSGSYFATERYMFHDVDGKAMINSAEQPYEPQHRQWFDDSIIVEFYTPSIDLSFRADHVNKVNDAEHWGFATRVLKLAIWEFDLMYGPVTGKDPDGIPIVKNVLHFLTRNDTWDFAPPDYGTQTLEEAGAPDPKDRYDNLDIRNTDNATFPGGNQLLTGGKFKADQTDVGADFFNYQHFYRRDFSALPSPANLPEALGGPAPP